MNELENKVSRLEEENRRLKELKVKLQKFLFSFQKKKNPSSVLWYCTSRQFETKCHFLVKDQTRMHFDCVVLLQLYCLDMLAG